jgi:hypothetical protein
MRLHVPVAIHVSFFDRNIIDISYIPMRATCRTHLVFRDVIISNDRISSVDVQLRIM